MDDRLHRALVALFVEALTDPGPGDVDRREGDGRDSRDRDVKPENVARAGMWATPVHQDEP